MPWVDTWVDFWAEHTTKEGKELNNPHLLYVSCSVEEMFITHLNILKKGCSVTLREVSYAFQSYPSQSQGTDMLGNSALSSVALESGPQ